MHDHSTISPLSATTGPATAKDLMPAQETMQNELNKQPQHNISIQCKLSVGSPDDPLEHEAETMADRVMRMPEQNYIQRKCAGCEEEEKIQRKPLVSFIQRKESSAVTVASNAVSNKINASKGSGSNMDSHTQNFMQSKFGVDFSDVKIHTGGEAIQMNRELNAKAFTVGNDVYFNERQFNPNSADGKHLLAHELTHTIQQGKGVQRRIQRMVHEGHDNYAGYSFDDAACILNYNQHWYFQFNVPNLSTAEKNTLMATAAQHIHDQWTGRFPLLPYRGGTGASTSCPCPDLGVTVNVDMTPFEGAKTGRGIQVTVRPSVRANVNPMTGNAELEHNTGTSDFRGSTYSGGLQYTIAHEFGHTIDITDEYVWISRLFTPAFRSDSSSMMNTGNDVRTRHYQYFGDLLSMEIPGCRYNPNGIREPEFENPVFRTATLDGITTAQDGLTFPGVATNLSLGTTFDRRISSERIFGVFYPEVGAISLLNPVSGSTPSIGATGGLRLGQIMHPLVFNLRTGVVFNPANPANTVSIPLNVQAGIRTSQFELGIQYTPVFNILNPSQVTHLFGASLSIPLP